MNYTTAIFLNDKSGVRAINCIYEPDTETTKAPRKLYKSFDTTLVPGDYVNIPTQERHLMTVVQVAEVDVEVDVSIHETSLKVDWIISKVDTSKYKKVLAAEQAAIAMIKDAEKKRKSKELREKLMEANPELQNLSFNADAALQYTPDPGKSST